VKFISYLWNFGTLVFSCSTTIIPPRENIKCQGYEMPIEKMTNKALKSSAGTIYLEVVKDELST
jgi:hypothetical protein